MSAKQRRAKHGGQAGHRKLPVLQEGVASSPMGRRRALVLILVHLLIAVHLVHWLTTGRSMTPLEPSEAVALGRDGVINAGLVFFLLLILSTAIFGRFFCGWGCHLVALQDLCAHLLGRIGLRPQPLRSRLLMVVPLLAFVYMFLWPLGYRLARLGGLGELHTEWTTPYFWSTFPGWIVGGLTFLICGFVAVWALGAKGFCTYACPYGAIFGVADKISPLRIRVTDACAGCGHCTAVCSSNVRVHEEVRDYGMVVDPGCMKCLDCVSVCPNDALYLGFGRPALFASPRVEQPTMRRPTHRWSEELVLGLAFTASFLAFRGLHAMVPFLMALGLAGVLAYGALLGWRLARRRSYSWRRTALVVGGRLTFRGWLAAGVLIAMGVVVGWAGYLRYHEWRGERLFHAAGGPRLGDGPPATGVVGELARAERELLAARRAGLLEHPATPGRLARIAWVRGDDARVEAEATRALEVGLDPDRAGLLRLRGRARSRLGAAAGAQQDLFAATQLAPLAELGWLELGIALAGSGELASARGAFEDGLAVLPQSAALAYNAGYAAALTGDNRAAEEYFRRALALRPGYREARENLAGLLASQGRFAEAADEFRHSLAEVDDPETRLLLARVLLALGRSEEAEAELARVLRATPDDPAALELQRELQEPRREPL